MPCPFEVYKEFFEHPQNIATRDPGFTGASLESISSRASLTLGPPGSLGFQEPAYNLVYISYLEALGTVQS